MTILFVYTCTLFLHNSHPTLLIFLFNNTAIRQEKRQNHEKAILMGCQKDRSQGVSTPPCRSILKSNNLQLKHKK